MSEIEFLVGTWRGEGKGEYPTIQPFAYGEELTFSAVAGKPYLAYIQRTWNLQTRAPMHAEVGYWRPVAPGHVEIVLAHPTGVAEIQEGTISGTTIEVAASAVVGTATAKEVTHLERSFVVQDDVLRYEVRMAAVGQPLQHHLAAELRRAP